MVRIVVGGPGLAEFPGSDNSDAYVKVVFPRPGVRYEQPLDLDRVRAELPPEQWPQQRTYTVRAWDPQAHELTLDFVVHGTEGVAGPWARSAAVGDEVLFLGPGGGYAPDPAADWHLLAGDESALPAIAAALERMASTATGYALIEVHDEHDEQHLTAPDGVQVRWVHRGDQPRGVRLVEAVTALEFLPGRVHAFVHGEAGFVRDLRRLLRVERGLPQSQLSISGYWRLGADDEGWRAGKRDWNQAIEAAEIAAGLN
jgi:NADPH-dependent ferric siderophore reductase